MLRYNRKDAENHVILKKKKRKHDYTLYIHDTEVIRDFHLIAISIAHTRVKSISHGLKSLSTAG